MKDKNTLFSTGNWNFYTKDNDYSFVYVSFYLGYNDVPKGKNIAIDAPIELRIPIDAWRKIILHWQDTEWGKNSQIDNTKNFFNKAIKEIIKGKKP